MRRKCSSQYLSVLNFNLLLLENIDIVIVVFIIYLIITFPLYPTYPTLPHPFNSTSLIQLFSTHKTLPHLFNLTSITPFYPTRSTLPHPPHSVQFIPLYATQYKPRTYPLQGSITSCTLIFPHSLDHRTTPSNQPYSIELSMYWY